MSCRPVLTPYEGGTFELTVGFSEKYPNEPPTVRFVTPMFHPNGLSTLHSSIALTCTTMLHSLQRWENLSGPSGQRMGTDVQLRSGARVFAGSLSRLVVASIHSDIWPWDPFGLAVQTLQPSRTHPNNRSNLRSCCASPTRHLRPTNTPRPCSCKTRGSTPSSCANVSRTVGCSTPRLWPLRPKSREAPRGRNVEEWLGWCLDRGCHIWSF